MLVKDKFTIVERRPKDPEVGRRIRRRRQELGLTQGELANTIKIAVSALSNYEAGRIPSDPRIFAKLAAELGVQANWLLTGQEPEPHEMRAASTRPLRAEAVQTWYSTLQSVVAGTPLKLHRPRRGVSGAKVERAWRELSEDRKEEIRNYLRRAALVAIAVEQLLSNRSAKVVIEALSAHITEAVTAKVVV